MLINSYRFGDADAAAYIAAVQAADGQALETTTAAAITAFIVGCKQDGIWSAIKASCILAGARTLAGALVPLVGTAPTNFNFVSGDYNRKTGLAGDGSTKTLGTNRAENADPQNSMHLAIYASSRGNNSVGILGDDNAVPYSQIGSTSSGQFNGYGQTSGDQPATISGSANFVGFARNNSSNYVARGAGTSQTIASTSSAAGSSNYVIYGYAGTSLYRSTARLAFYSIGESLDLALLDTRVTALITAISTAF